MLEEASGEAGGGTWHSIVASCAPAGNQYDHWNGDGELVKEREGGRVQVSILLYVMVIDPIRVQGRLIIPLLHSCRHSDIGITAL